MPKGNIASFLFGNVDESGELEADLDQETKKSLASFDATLAKRFLNLKEVIGEDGGRSVDDHSDYNRKAPNAVDYGDIEEMVDENTLDRYARAALIQPRRQKEEDYDAEEPQDFTAVPLPLPFLPVLSPQTGELDSTGYDSSGHKKRGPKKKTPEEKEAARIARQEAEKGTYKFKPGLSPTKKDVEEETDLDDGSKQKGKRKGKRKVKFDGPEDPNAPRPVALPGHSINGKKLGRPKKLDGPSKPRRPKKGEEALVPSPPVTPRVSGGDDTGDDSDEEMEEDENRLKKKRLQSTRRTKEEKQKDKEERKKEKERQKQAAAAFNPGPIYRYGASGQPLVVNLKSLLEEAQSGEMTPKIRKVISSLAGDGKGAILKFSEIFGPNPGNLIKEAPPKPPKGEEEEELEQEKNEYDGTYTNDEEEEFESYKDSLEGSLYPIGSFDWNTALACKQLSTPLPKQGFMDESLEGDGYDDNEEGSLDIGLPLLPIIPNREEEIRRKTKEMLDFENRLPESTFTCTEQVCWEEDIVWDDPDELVKEVSTTTTTTTSTSSFSSLSSSTAVEEEEDDRINDIDRDRDMDEEWEEALNFNNPKPKVVDTSTTNIKPVVAPPAPTTTPVPPASTKPGFARRNEEIEEGDWVESIIWDDSEASLRTPPVIIDLNDKEMIFDGDFSSLLVQHLPELRPAFKQATGSLAGATAAVESEQEPERPPPPRIGRPKGSSKRQVHFEQPTATEGEADQPVDPFNISNDHLYKNLRSKVLRKSTSIPAVHHSIPALKLSMYKTNMTPDELRNFHRPKVKFPTQTTLRVSAHRKEKRQAKGAPAGPAAAPGGPGAAPTGAEFIKHKSDLSAREGTLAMVEYTEEFPPIVNNTGMGTKIINYFRKRDNNDAPESTPEEGETVTLEPNDGSPFMGDVTPGNTVRAFENNMFKVPVAKHSPSPTDFLLIRSKDGKKLHLREMPPVFTAGQLQPMMEVPAPNSRPANNFVKNRLQVYIYRIFNKKGAQHRLRISDVCTAFPTHSETSIRKRLKDCADFQRGGDDSGMWTVKDSFQAPPEEELRALVPPEQVCLYESMLAAAQRLQDMGIEKLTSPVGITTALQQLEGTEEEKRNMRKLLHMLEEELQLTPWNLSSNFVMAQQGKCQLQLKGFGDPTRRGEAFSYLRLPQKAAAKEKKEKKKSTKEKSAVTGTDADLRKLSLEASRKILLKFGVPDDEIKKLSRWSRIKMIRAKSNQAAATGEHDSLTKFARGTRMSSGAEQSRYQEQAQDIFEKQLQALTSENPQFSDSDDESEEEDDLLEDLGMDLEEMLTSEPNTTQNGLAPFAPGARKRPRTADEEDEEEEMQELQKLIDEQKDDQQEQERKRARLNGSAITDPLASAALSNIGASSGDPTIQSITGEEKKKKKKVVIRRVITKKNPDGTETKKIEVIRDPVKVEEIMAKRRAKKEAANAATVVDADGKVIKKVIRPALSIEEEEARNKVRKEKRRLQEQLRRLRKTAEKQQILKTQFLAGSGESAEVKSGLVCSACGMPGHMRTNRICPAWSTTEANIAQAHLLKLEKKERRLSRQSPSPSPSPGPRAVPIKEEEPKTPKIILRLSKADLPTTSSASSSRRGSISSREPTPEFTPPPARSSRAASPSPSPTARPSAPFVFSPPATPTPIPPVVHPPPPSITVSASGSKIRITKNGRGGGTPLTITRPRPQRITSPSPPPFNPSPSPAPQLGMPIVTARTSSTGQLKIRIKGNRASSNSSLPTSGPVTTAPGVMIEKKRKRDSQSDLRIKSPSKKHAPLPPTQRLKSPTKKPAPSPVKTSLTKSGKGIGGASSVLINAFSRIVRELRDNPSYIAFRDPVLKKEAPDYRTVVKRPMDLSTVLKKCNNGSYPTAESLLADIQLIADNCFAYNRTRYQILIPVANQIVEDAKVMLAREEEVLRQTQILPTPRSPQPPALLPLAPSLLQLPLRDPGVEMENENEEVDVLR